MMQMTGRSEVAHFLLDTGNRGYSQLSQGSWSADTVRSQALSNKSICLSICLRLFPEDNENVTYPVGNVGAEKEGQKRL